MTRRTALAVAALLVALGVATVARADGEAGLVIQNGGAVETYCVAFGGDAISGEDLLRAAGKSIEQFGGGARTLCAIDDVGCFDASSFDGCFCQCKSGSGDCTYWAFFTQQYGASWVYSALAFNFTQAGDGDVHGWKWGSGSPSSAPIPTPITFEAICGHPPSGGQVSTPTPPPPTAATTVPPQTEPPPVSTTTAPPDPATVTASSTTAASPGASPTVTVTLTDTSSASATSGASPSVTGSPPASPTVTVTLTGTNTPGVPATGDSEDDGGGAGGAIAFGVVAGVLVAGIAGAVVWRRRHGA